MLRYRRAVRALAALALLGVLLLGALAAPALSRRPLPSLRIRVAGLTLYAPCRDPDTFYNTARGCIDATGRPRAGSYGLWLALPPGPGAPPPLRLLE